MESWRPKAAWNTDLSDRELAKLGLITQLEVQIYTGISMAVKALEGLDVNQWRNLDKTPLEQLVLRVERAALALDAEMLDLIREFEKRRALVLSLRHTHVHSLWGWDPVEGKPQGIYRRQHRKLEANGLDSALEELAALTFEAKKIAIRSGQLIKSGVLRSGNSTKAPKMFIDGEWIQF